MRVIIHAGLHKTATTYLQHLLSYNAQLLATFGIDYAPQPPRTAHHFAAWRALEGDAGGMAEAVEGARRRSARTCLISSEDLEGVLYRPELGRIVEQALHNVGATYIEWHFCLRDPGSYFSSIYFEMAGHHYVDLLTLYQSAIDRGYFLLAPYKGHADKPPFWLFCFDAFSLCRAFEAAIDGSVIYHDYTGLPFPASAILPEKVTRMLRRDLSETHINARRSSQWVQENYLARAEALLAPVGHDSRTESLSRYLGFCIDVLPDLSRVVSARFSAGMNCLLGRSREERLAVPSDFDPRMYLSLNEDVREAGMDPILHYLQFGKSERRYYK